jgi:ABC-type multidrug transport system ATPase subunit
MNAIEVRELTRVFRRGKVRAVDAVSFEVPQGTVLGLIGANGAGKSTLFRLLTGHIRPTSGTAVVLGHPVSQSDPSRWVRTGYVSQSRYLPGGMTGAECLQFARALRCGWDDQKVAQLVERLAFPRHVRIRELSRGHHVRLQIALALAHNPEVIFLDEPTAGLDPSARRELMAILIDEIGLRGRTVLFASHTMEDIERMADSVAIMDAGRIVSMGPLDSLKKDAGADVKPASLEKVFFQTVERRPE